MVQTPLTNRLRCLIMSCNQAINDYSFFIRVFLNQWRFTLCSYSGAPALF